MQVTVCSARAPINKAPDKVARREAVVVTRCLGSYRAIFYRRD
jgi:hypothetical protein